MIKHVVRRRDLLALLAALFPSPLAAAVAPSGGPIAGLLRHIKAARAVGVAYLAIAPQERSAAMLSQLLFGGMSTNGPNSDVHTQQLRQAIEARRQRDFANGETVILDGWLMARTEARLCALAALT